MKVLIINGSPRAKGNCAHLTDELLKEFTSLGVETEVFSLVGKKFSGCLACGYCHSHAGCVFHDEVDELAKKFSESDGLVLISPVYYASPNGTLIALLDRLFQSGRVDKRYKVGAAFAVARRAGTGTSFEVLNKYFTISGMPVASGDYWNNGFGRLPGEIRYDEEGLRNARIVARRMTFLIKSIALGKKECPELLEEEPRVSTHFIKPPRQG